MISVTCYISMGVKIKFSGEPTVVMFVNGGTDKTLSGYNIDSIHDQLLDLLL